MLFGIENPLVFCTDQISIIKIMKWKAFHLNIHSTCGVKHKVINDRIANVTIEHHIVINLFLNITYKKLQT